MRTKKIQYKLQWLGKLLIMAVIIGFSTIGAAADAMVDFQRGANGLGRIEVVLPKQSRIDVERRGQQITAKLHGGQFSQPRRLDVSDFGTLVKRVDIFKQQLTIVAVSRQFELVSYQKNRRFIIEFKRSQSSASQRHSRLFGDEEKQYTGKPLSLNFQDIEVRAVLQLIGDFTDTNIVVSDEVDGSITLRLNNVPWDQALDIILQTKGLSQQQNGNVIFVAPSSVIAKNKQAAYAVASVEKDLAPLQQRLIPVQYARAENLEKIIEDNSHRGDKSSVDEGLLSSRGSVSVDTRTNTLIVNDVVSSLDKVSDLIERLDTAVEQVVIETRIVSATDSFTHELGVRWGGTFTGTSGSTRFAGSGSADATSAIVGSTTGSVTSPSLSNRLGVNLGVTNPAGSLGLSVLGSDFLLDLELSALESDGRGEIISSPRVITQDGHEASIKQGVQIPYNKLDSSGNTTTVFKEANLALKVTPKIAPNRSVDMILEVDKDTPSYQTDGTIRIATNGVQTQVRVHSGETVVLGGVYEQRQSKTTSKVPLLGDLPIVGRAFRSDANTVDKQELLIFVTPRIIDKSYLSNNKFANPGN